MRALSTHMRPMHTSDITEFSSDEVELVENYKIFSNNDVFNCQRFK